MAQHNEHKKKFVNFLAGQVKIWNRWPPRPVEKIFSLVPCTYHPDSFIYLFIYFSRKIVAVCLSHSTHDQFTNQNLFDW